MANKKPDLDDIEVSPIDDFDKLQEKYDVPNWFKRQLNINWLFLLLFILLLAFTLIDHFVMRGKIEEIKQVNYQKQIEHSLDWNRMLSRKQELIIDKLYEKGIIRFGTYTQEALDRENKIWLKQQMARKVKNGHK